MNSLCLFIVAALASVGFAQESAKQDFSKVTLGQKSEVVNSTQIRLFASASDFANFSLPAVFPSDAQDGDLIRVSVDLEISNPSEGFDPRSGKAPESGLKSAELCNMTVALGSKNLWVGELLPTYKVLQIVSKHTLTYADSIANTTVLLSVRQDCPNPPSEFLVHGAKLFIDEPVSTTDASATATSSVSAPTSVSGSSTKSSKTSSTPSTVTSSDASISTISGLSLLIAAAATWWIL